jgi:hypothetical protein
MERIWTVLGAIGLMAGAVALNIVQYPQVRRMLAVPAPHQPAPSPSLASPELPAASAASTAAAATTTAAAKVSDAQRALPAASARAEAATFSSPPHMASVEAAQPTSTTPACTGGACRLGGGSRSNAASEQEPIQTGAPAAAMSPNVTGEEVPPVAVSAPVERLPPVEPPPPSPPTINAPLPDGTHPFYPHTPYPRPAMW